MKYDFKIVKNYILGEDVAPYDIDDLENDPAFMQSVIKVSKDKRMYELCGDNIRKDYFFTRFLLDTFPNDEEFCAMVANSFLELNDPDDILYKEMCVIMCEKFENSKHLDLFSLKTLTFYMTEMMAIDGAMERLESDEEFDNLGLGFLLVKNEYPSSEAIQSFFAKKMIEEIFFHSSEGSLNVFLHNHFDSYEDIYKGGINNTLINIILTRDAELARFAGTHISVLNRLKKEIESLKSTWTFDKNKKYTDRIESFLEEVTDYMEPIRNDVNFIEDDVIDYVVRKLGLQDMMNKYDYTKNIRKELRESLEIEPFDFENETLNLVEIKCLREMLQRAKETFLEGKLYDSSDRYLEQSEAEITIEPSNSPKVIPFKR